MPSCRNCEHCKNFQREATTEVGECKAQEDTVSNCKAIVYAKDSAKFCKEYEEDEVVES